MPDENQHIKVSIGIQMSHVGEAQMVSIVMLSPMLLMIKKQMKFNSFYFNTLNIPSTFICPVGAEDQLHIDLDLLLRLGNVK